MSVMRAWTRRIVFVATWGPALTACGLGVQGLEAVDDAGEDAGAPGPDASGAQSFDASVVLDGSKAPPAAHGQDGGDASGSADGADAASLDASAEAGGSCDEDGDGYLAAGGACHGNDCCDTDPQAHPGQTSFFTQQDHCGSFDYDCDGKVTPEYGSVSCIYYVVGCSGDGFQPPPPMCGAAGAYETCNLGLFTCDTASSTRVQGCR
jgi:hypothetical protein